MNVAVIFAGGTGFRLNAGVPPKQFLEILGKPVLIYTLSHFESHPEIDAVAIAIRPTDRDRIENLVAMYELTKVRWIVDGGETGQASRRNALWAVAQECTSDSIVLIHDGVRPIIAPQLISDNIESVVNYGCGVTCSAITETVVTASGALVDSILKRNEVFIAQAPQSFRLGEILNVYELAAASGVLDSIDSCSLMHMYGRTIHRVQGSTLNIKITTMDDFILCRALLEGSLGAWPRWGGSSATP